MAHIPAVHLTTFLQSPARLCLAIVTNQSNSEPHAARPPLVTHSHHPCQLVPCHQPAAVLPCHITSHLHTFQPSTQAPANPCPCHPYPSGSVVAAR